MDLKLMPSKIVELLERNGALKFDDLYKKTKNIQSGFNEEALSMLLMKMEIQGLVRVYRIPRGKRRVELA